MTFHFTANDLDQALRLLGLHFESRAEGAPGEVMEFRGEMCVKRIDADAAWSSHTYEHRQWSDEEIIHMETPEA